MLQDLTVKLIPGSMVKQPGFLMKDKKAPLPDKSAQEHLQNLLSKFRLKIGLQPKTLNEFPDNKPSEAPECIFQPSKLYHRNRTLGATSYSTDMLIIPKMTKGMLESTIKLAQEILKLYTIELTVEVGPGQEDKLYNILKYLILEICLFPLDLFQKLKMKQLYILGEGLFEKKLYYNNNVAFQLEVNNTQEEVRQTLHKTIFKCLMLKKPMIIEEWMELNSDSDDLTNRFLQIEQAFLKLMNTSAYLSLGLEIKKLRELIKKHFPEMSEEWFKEKLKERKKALKVCFTLNSDR